MKGSSVRKAYLFAILAVLFWSTSPTAFKLGLRYLDTWQLLTGAAIGSTLVLGILSLIRGNMRTLRLFTKRDILFSALMGLLNPVAYYLILFRAYTILPAQVAQPLNMVWPIVLVLLSIPILGQRIKWISIGAMVLSFAGVVLITLQGGDGAKDPQNRLGIILALSSSVIWAFYFLLNTRDRQDPVSRMFLNFAFASGTCCWAVF
jgi:drug/metabolite transporter (DMT)-like permease